MDPRRNHSQTFFRLGLRFSCSVYWVKIFCSNNTFTIYRCTIFFKNYYSLPCKMPCLWIRHTSTRLWSCNGTNIIEYNGRPCQTILSSGKIQNKKTLPIRVGKVTRKFVSATWLPGTCELFPPEHGEGSRHVWTFGTLLLVELAEPQLGRLHTWSINNLQGKVMNARSILHSERA